MLFIKKTPSVNTFASEAHEYVEYNLKIYV